MSAQSQPVSLIPPEEYLAADRAAEYKSEYYQGEVVAMAGASKEHNQIVANIITELSNQTRDKDCTVYASDLRLNNAAINSYTYPDVTAVCGPADLLADTYLDTLLNPTLLVEVLSPSTADNDRGRKFLFYRSIPSLQYYVLVETLKPQVEVFSRVDAENWNFREFKGLHAVVPFPALNLLLPLAEVYRKLGFKPS
jgi:Uma2 family endonuclease